MFNLILRPMQTQINKVDFSDQNFYCGIDIHKKSWSVTIETDNMHLKTFVQDPDPDQLVRFLNRNYPGGRYIAAYEAGYFGFSTQRKLSAQGVECLVVHPSDIPTTHKEKDQRRDKVDSRKIARSLRAGQLKPIWIPPVTLVQDRQLIRTRKLLVKDRVRTKNQIKAFLQLHGIEYPEQFKKIQTHWSRAYIQWLEELQLEEPSGTEALQSMVRMLKHTREELVMLSQKIKVLSEDERYNAAYSRLIVVPGIGRLTAMTILTEIGDIKRFRNADVFRSYIGLIPRSNSSGEKDYTGRITTRKSINLRPLLLEAAWSAIRTDPTYLFIYNQYKNRMDANKAIVRTTRKLANHIYFTLKEITR
jgi:transposase